MNRTTAQDARRSARAQARKPLLGVCGSLAALILSAPAPLAQTPELMPRLLELKAYCDKVVPKAQRGFAYVSTATLDSVKRGGVPPDEALVGMLHTAAVAAWGDGDAATARRLALEVPEAIGRLPPERREGFRGHYRTDGELQMRMLAALAGEPVGMDDAGLLREFGSLWLQFRVDGRTTAEGAYLGAASDEAYLTYCTFYPESGSAPQSLMHCPLRSAVDKAGKPLRCPWGARSLEARVGPAFRRAAEGGRLTDELTPGARAARWAAHRPDAATLEHEMGVERLLLAAWRDWCEPTPDEFRGRVDALALARLALEGETAVTIEAIEVATRASRLPLVSLVFLESGMAERYYRLFDPWIAAQPNPLDGILALEQSGIPTAHLQSRLERAVRLLPDPERDVPGDLCLRLAESMAEAGEWTTCRDWLLRMGRSHKPVEWKDGINKLCAAVAGELSPTDEGVLDLYIQMMQSVGCTLLAQGQEPNNIVQTRISYEFPMAEAERLRVTNPRRSAVLAHSVRDAVREQRLMRWGGVERFHELMFFCVESSCLLAAGATNQARSVLLPALMHERYAQDYASVCPPPPPVDATPRAMAQQQADAKGRAWLRDRSRVMFPFCHTSFNLAAYNLLHAEAIASTNRVPEDYRAAYDQRLLPTGWHFEELLEQSEQNPASVRTGLNPLLMERMKTWRKLICRDETEQRRMLQRLTALVLKARDVPQTALEELPRAQQPELILLCAPFYEVLGQGDELRRLADRCLLEIDAPVGGLHSLGAFAANGSVAGREVRAHLLVRRFGEAAVPLTEWEAIAGAYGEEGHRAAFEAYAKYWYDHQPNQPRCDGYPVLMSGLYALVRREKSEQAAAQTLIELIRPLGSDPGIPAEDLVRRAKAWKGWNDQDPADVPIGPILDELRRILRK